MTKQEVEAARVRALDCDRTPGKWEEFTGHAVTDIIGLIADRERLVEVLMPFALMWITPSPNVGVSHHVTEAHRTAFNLLHELKEVL